MKKHKIIFWVSTTFIFLFEGVMPALTGHTEVAKEGIRHLGYPDYFGTMLTVFKVGGSIILITPQFPRRLKEWAYAGFTFDFVFAFASLIAVDGLGPIAALPLFVLFILVLSYTSYQKVSFSKPFHQEVSLT